MPKTNGIAGIYIPDRPTSDHNLLSPTPLGASLVTINFEPGDFDHSFRVPPRLKITIDPHVRKQVDEALSRRRELAEAFAGHSARVSLARRLLKDREANLRFYATEHSSSLLNLAIEVVQFREVVKLLADQVAEFQSEIEKIDASLVASGVISTVIE